MKNFKILLMIPAIALMGCSEDSLDDYDNLGETDSLTELAQEDLTEMANPGVPGAVSDIFFAGQKLPVESFEGGYLYQGDIMFSKEMVTSSPVKVVYEKGEEIPAPQKSVGRTSGRWTDNTVYYAIDGNLSNQQRVVDAISHWEANTNIKFVKRSSQQNYVYFTSGSGCSSYIGMIGGKQNITLSTSCSTGNTIHEIGHAIGLWHEQSRVDRESHINILYENIKSGMEHNFKTYEEQGYDGMEFTSNLDFGSIMMYSSYSFSKNGEPTIVKTDGSAFSVQRSGLSSGDIQGINSMYPSSTTTGGTEKTTTEPTYINGEYYTMYRLTVLRYNDLWLYRSYFGWKQVELIDGRWYYVK